MSHDQDVYISIELPRPGPPRLTVSVLAFHLKNEQLGFRLMLRVEGLELQSNDAIKGELPGPHRLQFELRPPTDQEREVGRDIHSICIITGAGLATTEVQEVFAQLWEDESYLAADTIGYRSEPFSIGDDTQWRVATYILDPLDSLPAALRSFRDERLKELFDAAQKLVGWISWRSGAYGSPTLHQHSFHCTLNGTDWLLIPHAISYHHEEIPSMRLPESINEELVSLKVEDMAEPLGHELQREAWGQLHVRPRSALLLGIAAAEVGFKQWVSKIASDASWLVEVGPSPPLQSMLADYLPLLVRKHLGLEFVIPVSKQAIVKTIVRGVASRNTIAHSPPTSVKYQSAVRLLSYENLDELQELLLSVSDLLWILDYLWLLSIDRNLQWPLERVRPQTQSTWTLAPST